MGDEINPSVTVMLDKERHLKLTLSAMIAFKEATGKDLLDPKTIKQLTENATMEDLRALLWACLRHEDKSLTLEEAGDLVHIGNVRSTMAALVQAWMLAVPKGGEKEKSPLARKPRAG